MIFERICADDYDQIAPMAYVLMSCHAANTRIFSRRQFLC